MALDFLLSLRAASGRGPTAWCGRAWQGAWRTAGQAVLAGLAGWMVAGAAPARAADINPYRAQVQAFERHAAARLGLAQRAAPVVPQIVGGSEAPPGAFPAVVALLAPGGNDNVAAFYCGGTLIGRQHVLTAAHCVDFLFGTKPEVLVGTQNLQSGGTRMAVQTVTIHPLWNPDLISHDVAVLKLAQPVQGIEPAVFIASTQTEDRLVQDGVVGLIAGWGDTRLNAPQALALQQAGIEIWPASQCTFTDTSVMCAGGLGLNTGTCFGDSGGPLFAPQQLQGRRILVGVTSFGDGTCSSTSISFYARLATLGEWVRQQIRR